MTATPSQGCTAALGNFAKATFNAVPKTCSSVPPDLRKRLCSPSLLIRNSQTTLERPTPGCLSRAPRLQLWLQHSFLYKKNKVNYACLKKKEEWVEYQVPTCYKYQKYTHSSCIYDLGTGLSVHEAQILASHTPGLGT